MRAPRRLLPLALVPVMLAMLASCGESDEGAKAAATTTTPTTAATKATTSSSMPAGTDDEASLDQLGDDFVDRYRPGLELLYDGDTLDCVIAAFEDAALGDGSDEAAEAAYAACGTTAQAVAGAIGAAQLLEAGAAPDDARCMAEAFAEVDSEEIDSFSEAAGEAMFRSCGLNPQQFDG